MTADLESHLVAVDTGSGRIAKRIPIFARSPQHREQRLSVRRSSRIRRCGRGGLHRRCRHAHGAGRSGGRARGAALRGDAPDGERIAYVTDSALEQVVAIDLDRGRVVHRTRVPGPARHVSVDAGTTLWTVLGSAAERVAVLDLRDPRRPRLVRVFEPPFRAHDVVFAPDGTHVWVTSGASNALALYPRHGGAPRVLAAGAPPQHVAFADARAFVASGRDGTLQTRRPDGSPVRTTRVPHGSYNVTFGAPSETFGHPAVVTPSLNEGTVAVLRTERRRALRPPCHAVGA